MTRTKHIWQNGSRSHVISWIRTYDGVKRGCSCPNCEVNQEVESPSKPKINQTK